MLDTETKHRIDTDRDILVGKVPETDATVDVLAKIKDEIAKRTQLLLSSASS